MAKKQLPDDFRDFIQCLNLNKVRYLLVGGWAVGMHGHPRATKDIDFLIAVENNNLEALRNALLAFFCIAIIPDKLCKNFSVFFQFYSSNT